MNAVIPIGPTCAACLDRLITTTVTASAAPVDRQRRALACARAVVARLSGRRQLSPAHLANRVHPVINALCGTADPFQARKRIEIEAARRLAAAFAPEAGANLDRLMHFAALGNAIDFFRPLAQLEAVLRRPPPFALDRLEAWRAVRDGGGRQTILWLADNAGEVFFEQRVLIHLARLGHRVFYAIKAKPVQNDLSLRDWQGLGLDLAPANVISTGAATVGLELERVSAEFAGIFADADLVVAKGMGHFETLWGRRDPRVLFLFMAKCAPVAAAAGVGRNRLVAALETAPPQRVPQSVGETLPGPARNTEESNP